MRIWIILEGEKLGPFSDYEIRERIANGEFAASVPAWFDGMGGWGTLGEMAVFAKEFDREGPDAQSLEIPANSPEPASPLPPPLPRGDDGSIQSDGPRRIVTPREDHRPGTPVGPPKSKAREWIRRFFARWFDMHLYAAGWWLGLWWAGRDLGEMLGNPFYMITMYLPWAVIEALLIHHIGTTPGKWLLGIRVRNADGEKLSLQASTRRALTVLALGVGFAWGPLSVVCQALSWLSARKLGKPAWDLAGKLEVSFAPGPRWFGLVTVVAGIFFALQLQTAALWPYLEDRMAETMTTFPALKEQFDRNPPWHLPKRGSGE